VRVELWFGARATHNQEAQVEETWYTAEIVQGFPARGASISYSHLRDIIFD
jgi:hypothetical protein